VSPRLTALGLLLALLLQATLGLLLPDANVFWDPLLIVVVYAAVTRGEVAGLLAGTGAGWLADVAFGPPVLGLTAMSRLLIGWTVGAAGARLMLASASARLLVLVAATLADARLLEWLATAFGVDLLPLPPSDLAMRAAANAIIGVALFAWLDRKLPRESAA
jgi:rod shape-determining protein MreD